MRVKIRVARSTDTIVQTVGLKDLTSNLARTKGMVLHFAGVRPAGRSLTLFIHFALRSPLRFFTG